LRVNVLAQYIGKSVIESLMRLSHRGDLKLTFKLTELHLHAKGHQHQKVRLATQLFSRTMAKAIQYYGDKNALSPSNWKKVNKYLFICKILTNNYLLIKILHTI